MKKVFGVSFIVAVLSLVLLLQVGVLTFSQQGTNPLPPQGPNNCDDPNRLNDPFGPGPHLGGNVAGSPQPPAGPPCPPVQSPPVQTPPQEPLPPQGPNNCDDPNRLNDPFGPGPHIGVAPTSPGAPTGPPCPTTTLPPSTPIQPPLPPAGSTTSCYLDSTGVLRILGPVTSLGPVPPPQPQPPAGSTVVQCPPIIPTIESIELDMLLPPSYRVGSAPYVWIKTDGAAHVYVLDVDPQRQIFMLPGVQVSTANEWHLFGLGAWLGNPLGIDSVNFIASRTPLTSQLEAAIMDSQNYVWAGQYYVLSQAIQQQLASIGAGYIHQGYEITN